MNEHKKIETVKEIIEAHCKVHYIDAEVNKQESKSPFSVNTYDQIVFDEANGLDYRNMYF